MAKAPTQKQVKQILKESAEELKQKVYQNATEAKDFVDYGQGVIPEEVWKNLPGKES